MAGSITYKEFADESELIFLKRLEALVRISLAYPNSVAEQHAKPKIVQILKTIDSLYGPPFDVEAACQAFLKEEMNDVLDRLRGVVADESTQTV